MAYLAAAVAGHGWAVRDAVRGLAATAPFARGRLARGRLGRHLLTDVGLVALLLRSSLGPASASVARMVAAAWLGAVTAVRSAVVGALIARLRRVVRPIDQLRSQQASVCAQEAAQLVERPRRRSAIHVRRCVPMPGRHEGGEASVLLERDDGVHEQLVLGLLSRAVIKSS